MKALTTNIENDFTGQIGQQISSFEYKISDLSEQLKHLKDTSLNTEEISKRIQEEQRKFNEYFDKKKKEFVENSDTKITDITRSISKFEIELKSIREKESDRVRVEMDKLQTEIVTLEDRIEAFEKDTKIFRKGEKLSDKLNREMEIISDQLKRIKDEKDSSI